MNFSNRAVYILESETVFVRENLMFSLRLQVPGACALAVLAIAICALPARSEEKLLFSFEQGDVSGVSGSAVEASAEHATQGAGALKARVEKGSDLRFARQADLTGWDKIKLDAYLEGKPLLVTATFEDSRGGSYTAWYQLIRSGRTTIEYSIGGLATKLDLKSFAAMTLKTEGQGNVVWIDNVRLSRGADDDSWLLAGSGSKPLLTTDANIVPNGDFETGTQGWAAWGEWDGGKYTFGSGKGDDAKSGTASASIICEKPGRGGMWTKVALDPGEYDLSFWLKADKAGGRIKYAFEGHGGAVTSGEGEAVEGGTDWAKKEYKVSVAKKGSAALYFYNVSPATIYLDAISMTLKGGAAAATPQAGATAQGMKPRKVALDGRRVLVDGKPFFPIGIYNGPPAELAGTGYNMTTGDSDQANLDECEKHGLMTWAHLGGIARAHAPEGTPGFARKLKDHPALLCWYNCDEPDHAGYNVPPAEVRIMTKLLHKEDPNHPTSTVVMDWAISNFYQYRDTVDILMTDPYSFDSTDVAMRCAEARKAGGNSQPVWAVLRLGWDKEKEPTREYVYATSYSALAEGADGIFWFAWSYAKAHPNLLKVATDVSLEMKEIAPEMVGDVPAAMQPKFSKAGMAGVVRKTAASTLIIAVNKSDKADLGEVEIEVPGLGSKQAVELFANRPASFADGKLKATFGPAERRVYRVKQ